MSQLRGGRFRASRCPTLACRSASPAQFDPPTNLAPALPSASELHSFSSSYLLSPGGSFLFDRQLCPPTILKGVTHRFQLDSGYPQPARDGVPGNPLDPSNRGNADTLDSESDDRIKGSSSMLETVVGRAFRRRERLSALDAPVSTAFPRPRSVETVADDAPGTDFSVQRTLGVETAELLHFAGPCRRKNCVFRNRAQTLPRTWVRRRPPTLDRGSTLEPGDHIMTWGDAEPAYRYCHAMTDEEGRSWRHGRGLPGARPDGEDRTLALKLLTVEEAASMPPSDTSCSTPSSCWMKGRQETIAPPVRAINHLIRTARSSWHAAQPFSVSAASTTAL